MNREPAPLHIAIFANNLHPYRIGGMQKHTTRLIRHLSEEGVRTDVYYRWDGSQPADVVVHQDLFDSHAAVTIRSVPLRILPRLPGHYYVNCWWESRALWKAMQASGVMYDFIYAQGYTGWYGATSARAHRDSVPPVGVHAHGIEALQEPWNGLRLVRHAFAPVWQRSIIRAADFNLSLGGRLDELVVTAGGDPDTILPGHNGVDRSWLAPIDEIAEPGGKTRFLFVGRDSTRKGFNELNHAIRRLHEWPRFSLEVVGPVADKNRVVASNVTYHGLVRSEARLREIYHSCDVLLCPSYSEGMPTVILEAMASGLAVIATDVGAVRMVVDEHTGWLIPRHNSDALVNAMREAMAEPLMPRKRAGRRRVEDHTWPVVTERFVKALRGLLHS